MAAECFDVAIGVECPPTYVQSVSAHMPFGSTPISPTRADHVFVLKAETQDETLFSVRRELPRSKSSQPQSLDSALKTLQKEIHICIAEHARNHVFIHAGVVAWKNQTFVFPGFSHAGKSTLVWTLVQAGAVYFSDEYAVFDEQGRVHPFPLPIALRSEHGARRMIMPDNIANSCRKTDFIVFTRYRPDANWHPRLLQPAAAMMRLVRHSIAIRANPALVVPILKHLALQSKVFAGTRGQSKQLLHWLETVTVNSTTD